MLMFSPGSAQPSRRSAVAGRRPRTIVLTSLAALAAMLVATALAPASARVPEPEGTAGAEVRADARAERECTVSRTLVPSCGSWWGAVSSPEGAETATEAIHSLEANTRERADIVHWYFSGAQIWPPPWLVDLAREPGKKRLLAINWKPEAGHSWAATADGAADAYIDEQAAYLRANFRERFFLTIHHEPEDEVIPTPGSGYTAADYADMYRHVVNRLRARGVDNAVYVMNYMGSQGWGLEPWFPELWPGRNYVDWIAYDPYATPTLGDQDRGVAFLLNSRFGDTAWVGAYRYFTNRHPGVPIMLGEWGIGEKPGVPAWKARFFDRLGDRLRHRYPMLKALLYYDHRYGEPSGDTRPETSPQALAAMEKLLDRRVWAPAP